MATATVPTGLVGHSVAMARNVAGRAMLAGPHVKRPQLDGNFLEGGEARRRDELKSLDLL